ncbi:MAG: helix-turn-helix transcriptional regulator [Piscinibacter sp.]|nr:helix-turn-helix transcriptional regulator [Piscinibacter sp.]
MTPEPDLPLHFGRFRLDVARRVLLADGRPAKLRARAVDVLVTLVERRDRVVSKEELLEIVWAGLVVEENNLQVHVSALRKLLGPDAIVTVPGRGYQFVAPVEGTSAEERSPHPEGVLPDARAARTNLPATPPLLFGREQDGLAVAELLGSNAVVTLAGPSGVGKTALAQAVAHRLLSTFADGVWWVGLSALREPEQVVPLVCRVLGIGTDDAAPVADTVGAALRAQSLLLVLDNCEHLSQAAAALVQALLHRAPGLRVLATSQESLRIAGEQVYRLSALPVADADVEYANRSGALQLFAARARAVVCGFTLTAENLAVVGDICRSLDGLPLAIELAAARLPLLGLDGIRARLDERFRLLTVGSRMAPPRHRALQAAFEWSYELLSDAERAVFRRLGVFVGGFSLALAQRVAADERADAWQVVEQLGALVDKSLVVAQGARTPRYHLLETVRAFALDRLAEADEIEALRRAHAQALREVLEESDRAIAHAPRFDVVMSALEPELDNLRAALGWAIDEAGDRELAVALFAATDWLWNETDLWREGRQWLQKLLPWIDDTLPTALRARCLLTAAGLGRVTMSPVGEWAAWAEQAAAGFRACDDEVGLYRTLCLLGQAHGEVTHEQAGRSLDEAERIEVRSWSPRLRLRRAAALELWYHLGNQLPKAREEGLRCVALAREAGGAIEVAALSNLADTERALGNLDAAIELCRAAITRAVELGRGSAAAHVYSTLAPALMELGRLDEAAAELHAGREVLVRAVGTAFSLLPYLPVLALARGEHRLAVQLAGCAQHTYQRTGRSMWPYEQQGCERVIESSGAELPSDSLQALLAEGAAWDEDEAFSRAAGEQAVNAAPRNGRARG